MSGEASKKSGESGERVVDKILELIGWETTKNFNINCVFSKKHKSEESSSGRRTHGIDFLTFYECPLSMETQETVVISAKYTKQYPANTTKKLKTYLKDLTEAIECLRLNKDYGGHTVSKYIKRKNYTGVIFWLAYENDRNLSIIPDIDDFRNSNEIIFDTIFLVDNAKANFLYKTMNYAKLLYPNKQIEFIYHETGHNISPFGRVNSGKFLPVHLINSSIIPLKIKDAEEEILLLSIFDLFSEESLKRLIGLTQSMTQGWGNKVIICFPDYHELKHSSIVGRVKSLFSDNSFTKKISIKSFQDDFKSLEEEV